MAAARLTKAVGQQGLAPSLGLVSGFFQVSFREPRLMAELQSTGAKPPKAGALKASASRPPQCHDLKPELVRQGGALARCLGIYCTSHCLRLSLLWSQPPSRARCPESLKSCPHPEAICWPLLPLTGCWVCSHKPSFWGCLQLINVSFHCSVSSF